MKNATRSVGAIAVLAFLACDGHGGAVNEALTVTCPEGQVPWDFYRFRNGLDDDSLRRLGPDAGSGDPLVGEPNYLILQKAECKPPGKTSTIDVLADFKKFCPARSATCLSTNEYYTTRANRAKCGGAEVQVTYTCFEDQQVRTAADLQSARCPSHPIERVTCVPQSCYGHTRRDAVLHCAPDLIKTVEHKDGLSVNFDVIERPLHDPLRASPDAYSGTGATSVITFDDDQMYRFKGSIDTTTSTAPRQLLSLWLKSVVSRPGSTQTLDIFRCFIGRIDLRKYEPKAAGSGWSVAFDEKFRIPPECKDGATFSKVLKTGWLASGYQVSDGPIATSAQSTVLMASYDLEGNAILQSDPVAIESTCSPNPVDFFFNYTTKVHNNYDYYSQTTVPVVHRKRSPSATPAVQFNAVPNNLIAATSVEVPLLEYKVNKAGRAQGSIDATVVVALSGPDSQTWARFLQTQTSSGANALFTEEYPNPKFVTERSVWSKGRRLSMGGLNLFDIPGTATALVPIPDTAVLGPDGEPVADYGGLIRVPEESLGLQFDGSLSETGAGALMRVKINNAVRSALFNPNGRYPLKPGSSRNYMLQVCAEGKVTEDFVISLSTGYNLYVNGEFQGYKSDTQTYTKHVGVAPADPRQNWMGQFDPDQVSILPDGAASTLKTAKNNCARSAVFSIKGENIVTPLPEVEAGDGDASDLNPTSSGDPDRLQSTFNSDTTQACSGTRCETTTEQTLGGTDAPIQTTVLSIVNDETEDDTTNQFQTSFKMFGFDVLDAVENGAVGPVETTITVSPNYEAIAKAFGKPYPAFSIEAGRVAAGVNGLSVGFEYKVPVHYGPLQGDLIFGVGAGAGINAEVVHTYNPKVASSCAAVITDGGTLPDGCPDPMLAMPALPFREARDLCFFLGGRLVEPRSDLEESEMRKKVPAATETWVGAQVGNEYRENTECAQSWNTPACSAGHKTYLRWLSDAENFRRATSFGGFENFGTNPVTTLSGTALRTETLVPGKPVDSAVTLQGATFRARSMSDPYPSVCKRPLISSGTSHEVGIKLNLAVGAGFSVAFCVPSDELGACLEGSMNLIEAKLTPGVSVTHTQVKNNAGAKASQTKFGAKVAWSVNLLSGALEIKLVSPFGDIGYTLLDYEGFKVGEGTLAEFEYDFKDFPVGF